MNVLSFNVGYFLGYRSQRAWLRRPHRLLVGSEAAEQRGIAALVDLIDDERPDVVALQEVDQGSFRARWTDQSRSVVEALRDSGIEYQFRVDTKYGPDKLVSGLPVLRNMSNMLLWRDGVCRAHYLSHGTKRLVHVLEREDGPDVIAVHLSKTRYTRRKQLREIASLVDDRRPVILAGDFNVKDHSEFDILTNDAELELCTPGKSFSTAYPTYAFDLFLASGDVSVDRCDLFDDVTASDHMPVAVEVSNE